MNIFLEYAWVPVSIGLTFIGIVLLWDDAYIGLGSKLRKKIDNRKKKSMTKR